MSTKPIGVGDLVMVVRPAPCCGSVRRLGAPFIITAVLTNIRIQCGHCGGTHVGNGAQFSGKDGNGIALGCDLSRLIRIDPPAIEDDVPTAEEMLA